MKILKKIIGYIIIVAFILLVISSVIYKIMTSGWVFLFTIIALSFISTIVCYGFYLISGRD